MKKSVAAFMAVLLAAGSAGGAYYHFIYKKNQNGSAGSRVSSTDENAVYVSSVSVIAGLGSGTGQIQRLAGVVVPQETWSAKLENDRSVKETYVKEGDMVKAGDKLFTYDTAEEQDKVEQAEIDIQRAQNDIETSKAQVEQLKKEQAKAKSDEQLTYTTQILSEENSIKQNEYEIKSKQLEIESIKTGIQQADVVSKIDGVVKSVANPNSNSNSDSGSDAYITIMQVGDYRVKGTLNEQNINEITEDDRVICYSRVDSSQYWVGSVTKINRDSGSSNENEDGYSDSSGNDTTSSTNYPFYIAMDSSEGLMLGQHLYIERDQGQLEQKSGIWIPDYYIVTAEDGSHYVWAASSKDVLEKRTVTLGSYDEGLLKYEIVSGLTAEDFIASADDTLTEGTPLIFNDDSEDDESVYGSYDVYGDGSWEDFDDGSFYFDDGSFDWDEDSYYDADAEDATEAADASGDDADTWTEEKAQAFAGADISSAVIGGADIAGADIGILS